MREVSGFQEFQVEGEVPSLKKCRIIGFEEVSRLNCRYGRDFRGSGVSGFQEKFQSFRKKFQNGFKDGFRSTIKFSPWYIVYHPWSIMALF